jgi:hypothetical protein
VTETIEAGVTPGLEARWQAWRAHRAAHDRATERKLFRRLPLLLLVVAIAYVLLAG